MNGFLLWQSFFQIFRQQALTIFPTDPGPGLRGSLVWPGVEAGNQDIPIPSG